MRTLLPVLIFLAAATAMHAQSLFMPREMQAAYTNGTRADDGQPGKNYWQNSGDYTIAISFNPKTLLISGQETITYYNNSPDTLDGVIFHLYPDYYKHGAFRNYPIDEKDENDGVTIDELQVGGKMIGDRTPHHADADTTTDKLAAVTGNTQLVDGTNRIVVPQQPLLPHSKTAVYVKWHYTLDSGSQNRTGQIDSTSSFVAYFFPRIAVYDDVDGWDTWPSRGIQEFYNDFCNFNVNITVPKGYVVWATGDLQNESEVLSPAILTKWNAAKQSAAVVHVIDSTDYKHGMVTTNHTQNTWKFAAANVTDFVFATSDHYLWDAVALTADKNSGRKVLVETAFNKNDKDYFDVIYIAQRSVDMMCDTFPAVPFPFGHITVVDGTDQMEYPMMVNDNPTESWLDAVQLTSHEITHSYFPFYMGINETKYAWMDEGWATLGESIISPFLNAPEDDGVYRREKYERMAGTSEDVPMITNSELQDDEDYYANSYGKPGVCYWVLKDMLGDEKFFRCLHAYMNTWNGKHPTPYDFFNSFNEANGESLNWFWQKWFFEWGFPDVAIKNAEVKNGMCEVVIERKGNIPVPVDITVTLTNGSTIHHRETPSIWKNGETTYTFTQKTDGEIKSVHLGDIYTPDSNRDDNEWPR